jgi:murein DD-endopeptidase MepM/ murein hydrolase activator NlpD
MNRALALAVSAAIALASSRAHADVVGADVGARASVEPSASLVDRVAHEAAEAFHGATEVIARLVPAPVPDLTMLTTQPIPNTLSSGYGWRDDPIRHRQQFHSGTDFPADYGTPVLAAGAGTVIFAGRFAGYGNCVQIDHGNGVITLYGHLRKIETKKDAVLAAGDRIGQVGSTGRATGPHLHFEIRLGGHPVDPVAAMSIAELWRESPISGRIAAYQLTPDRQKHLRAYSDRRDGPKGPRPERAGRVKQAPALW